MNDITTTKNTPLAVEVCKTLFGELPGDVVAPLRRAVDALDQITEILKVISAEAIGGGNTYRIQHLAKAAEYIASDMGECAGCAQEGMETHLRSAGFSL